MANNNSQFKTNLNCSSCVGKVTADLNEAIGEGQWTVDTTVSDKILTLKNDVLTAEEVVNIIKKKGFKAEAL
ncbi:MULTISPECIES: heavy-metal-associated domain-containing protein [unclassified Myroides]|uniref:heavy-metal-associated domain-containing protein n=1 Tax=unclassified Myroides TaxID=2642485 RepID=UPI003D2F770C